MTRSAHLQSPRSWALDAYARFADAKSMQTSFLRYLFGGYLAQFDVIMRKLIFELQACSQCILIASMRRDFCFRSFERSTLLLQSGLVAHDPHCLPQFSGHL